MRVLLTNDDSYSSIGLAKLKQFVLSLGFCDIWTVAPLFDKSACSHSLTISKFIELKKISDKTFALDGTPADCVIVAIEQVFAGVKKPDIIFSGVNCGANVGFDKIYSGTVAAAREATFFGIPSIAISQLYSAKKQIIKWNCDSEYLRQCVISILGHKDLLKKCTISINLPYQEVIGVKYIEQGMHKMTNLVDYQNDKDKAWIKIDPENKSINCDMLKRGYITVTPICCNLTDYCALNFLNENLA